MRDRGTGSRRLPFLASLALLGAVASPLAAAHRFVDCRPLNPSGSPYTSITAAINSLTDPPPTGSWDQILLRSDCTENVTITRGRLWIAPYWDACPWSGCTTNGPVARIAAADPDQPVVSVAGPHDVTLVHLASSGGRHGLAVRGPASVDTYGIAAENNSTNGVIVEGGAMVVLAEPTLVNNGGRGLDMSGSTAEMFGRAPWLQNKPCLVSGNGRTGMFVSRSVFRGADGCVVENNQMRGVIGVGGHVEFGAYATEAVIRGNQGGAQLVEGSEGTFWGGVVIQNNGPFGLHMERQSQAGFHECCGRPAPVIEGHTEIGVAATQHSQIYFKGTSRVRNNGTAGGPLSAGVRVDGNSAAFMDGGARVNDSAGPASWSTSTRAWMHPPPSSAATPARGSACCINPSRTCPPPAASVPTAGVRSRATAPPWSLPTSCAETRPAPTWRHRPSQGRPRFRWSSEGEGGESATVRQFSRGRVGRGSRIRTGDHLRPRQVIAFQSPRTNGGASAAKVHSISQIGLEIVFPEVSGSRRQFQGRG